jgi:GNAT superfamily N-acetyltransferase
MSGMGEVAEFVPERASREEWARYHAFRRAFRAEWRPEEPPAPDDVVELRMKRPGPEQHHHWYRVLEGGEMVAELQAEGPRPESPEYATNRHILWAWAYVLRAHRCRGIGRGFVPTLLALMDEHGATVLSSMGEDEPADAFLRGLGAEPKMVERVSRLDLRELDWDMVARWVAEGAAASPGARLELYAPFVPDALLERHCVVLNELLNTMPFEGMDHGDIVVTPESLRDWRERLTVHGSALPTCRVREADGSITGVTDVLKHAYEPGIVRQMFTGVHPTARGRGLGKWLKAAMLQHLREAYPDAVWVTTENAGSNGPMLAINHALGFRLHRTQTFYQVGRDALRAAS